MSRTVQSVKLFDSFIKQIAALGFEAIETFDFHLGVLTDLFGSLPVHGTSCRSEASTGYWACFTQ